MVTLRSTPGRNKELMAPEWGESPRLRSRSRSRSRGRKATRAASPPKSPKSPETTTKTNTRRGRSRSRSLNAPLETAAAKDDSYSAAAAPAHSGFESGGGGSVLLFPLRLVLKFALWLHDVYYYFIQAICAPFCRLVPRKWFGYDVFTANGVTYARTFMVLAIAACMKFNYNGYAAFLIMYHDFLDHVDGVVAKVQREDGRAANDNGLYGAFIDAFCDKIVFCLTLWTLLALTDYSTLEWVWIVPIVTLSLVLFAYEFAIGVVRVTDYFHVSLAPANAPSKRALRAVMEGKLKQKLESVGMAVLAYTLPTASAHPEISIAGLVCMFGAVVMAHESLSHKLRAWKEE